MPQLICNQNDIPKNVLRYGIRSSAGAGCGWIATYNAMALMGYRVEPKQLIRYFERQVPLINGSAGTAFFSPALCFRQWGFPTEVTVKREKMDDLARRADACILYYRWRDGLRTGAHFAAFHREEKGFVGYNTFRNSKGPDFYGESVEEFLRKHGYFAVMLTAIHRT